MSRHGKKWTVNEELSLQRDYELLKMPVDKIAEKYKRSVKSILYKLQNQGIIHSDDKILVSDNKKPTSNVSSSKNKFSLKKDNLLNDDELYEDLNNELGESDYDSSSDYEYEEDEDDDDDDDDDDYEDFSSLTELKSNKKELKGKMVLKDVETKNHLESNHLYEVDKLTDRVWSLETNVNDISSMVKQLFDKLIFQNKSKKLAPLRKLQ